MNVYAIGVTIEKKTYIKVGKACDIRVRLSDLQIANPRPLTVMGLWRFSTDQAARAAESLFHVTHAKWCESGEWFVISLDLIRCFMLMPPDEKHSTYGVAVEAGMEIDPPSSPGIRTCLSRTSSDIKYKHYDFVRKKAKAEKDANRKPSVKNVSLIKSILEFNRN